MIYDLCWPLLTKNYSYAALCSSITLYARVAWTLLFYKELLRSWWFLFLLFLLSYSFSFGYSCCCFFRQCVFEFFLRCSFFPGTWIVFEFFLCCSFFGYSISFSSFFFFFLWLLHSSYLRPLFAPSCYTFYKTPNYLYFAYFSFAVKKLHHSTLCPLATPLPVSIPLSALGMAPVQLSYTRLLQEVSEQLRIEVLRLFWRLTPMEIS